jgi:hypothetical protein
VVICTEFKVKFVMMEFLIFKGALQTVLGLQTVGTAREEVLQLKIPVTNNVMMESRQ